MIPANLQTELNRHVQGGIEDASELGKALRWQERGWPEWTIYQPIAETARGARLPLVAGGLDADVKKAVAEGPPSPLYGQTAQELGLAQPLRPEIAEAEGLEIEEGHCNLLRPGKMLRVQRALDASLAKAMASANASEGVVLIAGAGPTPSAYVKRAPGLEKPFDFIYLTPKADLTDDCADIEKQLKRRGPR